MKEARRLAAWAALGGILLLATGCAPRTFVRNAPGWKVIELREGLRAQYDDAWQTAVDTIARNWDIEILDKDSGYLRTAWMHGIGGAPYDRYRARVTLKFPEVELPEKVEVKTEAQWLQDKSVGWLTGLDSTFQRDVYAELAGRLGRTVPKE